MNHQLALVIAIVLTSCLSSVLDCFARPVERTVFLLLFGCVLLVFARWGALGSEIKGLFIFIYLFILLFFN